jgi:hypothetical protein
MLASDLVMQVRASRSVSREQAAQLERILFAGGCPTRDHLELLHLIDSYAVLRDPRWTELIERAAAAMAAGAGEPVAA